MFKTLSLASIAAAVTASGYGPQASYFRNYGGSSSGNRLVDDLHDAYPDPTSPYGNRHTSGAHTDLFKLQ